ncbi:hypothetical protein [Rhizomonospora bruguierae]|uniref:hypothetical protein n=1 Tax=Rhizomonospora bruguierae TaxID=1581705 RepID=UPI001BD02824|nr:hypothetical protein [Micromonospora sp. NBRC 107566]
MAGWRRTRGLQKRVGWFAGVLGGVVALVVVIAGTTDPPSYDSYRDQVRQTAKQVSSAVAAADWATRLELSGRTAFALSRVVVSEAATDASESWDTLAKRRPPNERAMELRQRAVGPMRAAVSGLAELRTAVRGRNASDAGRALAALVEPARQLRELQRVA